MSKIGKIPVLLAAQNSKQEINLIKNDRSGNKIKKDYKILLDVLAQRWKKQGIISYISNEANFKRRVVC
ncbi:MAG: hypothetical protein KGZ33_02630 [Alkaliphilus sp.]|nr:hypothetical protein [Alkaliphilus sp.]